MYLTDNIIKLSNKIGQRVSVGSEMSIEAWITKEPQPFVLSPCLALTSSCGSDWGQLFDYCLD